MLNHAKARALTEDQLAERAQVIAAASADPHLHAAVRAKLHEHLLAADMAAFKAANPGCVLEDFTAWRRPEEYTSHAGETRLPLQELAEWESTWAATAPAALDAAETARFLEGQAERALHWLETVSHVTAMRQLLGVAVDGVVQMMRSCEGARLPTASAVVDRYAVECVYTQ